jgi:NAD(P)-dependent dehydrogenase (short-subunit alcohol dehydrogenase family)
MTDVVLVTGAGREDGLGFEVCRQLADQGHTVILTARNGEAATRLASKLSANGRGQVFGHQLDVADPGSREVLATFVEDEFELLDVLVNNAAGGAQHGEQAADADLDATRVMFEDSFFGAWSMIQALLPLLEASANPRIVNVSSGAGSHGDRAFGLTTGNAMGPSYATAKAALNALTASFAQQLGPRFRINAVCPGLTATFPGGLEMGARPVDEGAQGIVWAASLPFDGATGGFFRDGNPIPW